MFKVRANKDNKVTVVTKTDTLGDLERGLAKAHLSPIEIFDIISGLMYLPDKFVAKSRCLPCDEYDEKTGVNIAVDKYKAKYKKANIKAIDSMIKACQKYIKRLEEYKKRFMD